MLDLSRDIDSLNNFKKNTTAFLQRMRKTGTPIVLTVGGKARVVVQDAAAYQRVREIAGHLVDLDSLRRSLADADKGRVKLARQVVNELGIPKALAGGPEDWKDPEHLDFVRQSLEEADAGKGLPALEAIAALGKGKKPWSSQTK